MPDSFVRRVLRRAGVGRRDRAIELLTKAVRELADAQRQQAAQLKKLLEAQKAQDRRWEAAGAHQILVLRGTKTKQQTHEMIRLMGEHVIPKIDTDPLHRTTRFRDQAS